MEPTIDPIYSLKPEQIPLEKDGGTFWRDFAEENGIDAFIWIVRNSSGEYKWIPSEATIRRTIRDDNFNQVSHGTS